MNEYEGFYNYHSPFDVNPVRHHVPNWLYYVDVNQYEDPVIREVARKKLREDIEAKTWETNHEKWVDERELFAKHGEQEHLDEMLTQVTLENPPPAKDVIWMETEEQGFSPGVPAWIRQNWVFCLFCIGMLVAILLVNLVFA